MTHAISVVRVMASVYDPVATRSGADHGRLGGHFDGRFHTLNDTIEPGATTVPGSGLWRPTVAEFSQSGSVIVPADGVRPAAVTALLAALLVIPYRFG